jgi:hypothetical protein
MEKDRVAVADAGLMGLTKGALLCTYPYGDTGIRTNLSAAYSPRIWWGLHPRRLLVNGLSGYSDIADLGGGLYGISTSRVVKGPNADRNQVRRPKTIKAIPVRIPEMPATG